MVGTLIVLGIFTAIGVSGAIVSACTEDERARARIDELQAQNNAINAALKNLYSVQRKLQSAINYLTSSKTDFTNGGWVNNGIPLANNEFGFSMTKVNNALTNCNNLINDFNNTFDSNNAEITRLSAKLPKDNNKG